MEQIINASETDISFLKIAANAGYAESETIIRTDNRPVAVIIGYKKYLELRRHIRERDERFAVYDDIRNRNRNAVLEQVESDVAAAIKSMNSLYYPAVKRQCDKGSDFNPGMR